MRIALIQCAIAGFALALIEGGLRLGTGGPNGVFLGWFPGPVGLYPENAEIRMPGVVPWVIKTNRWGFRGAELSLEKTQGTLRIAMIGDSVTDGFFVENENTYPAFTEARLRTTGLKAEVMNLARGGATIDTELAILRDVATPFEPDIVVLTFVTNDIAALSDVSDENLLNGSLAKRDLRRAVLQAMVTRSALGERVFDAYLRLRSPGYRSDLSDDRSADARSDRYAIQEGGEFTKNARRFMERLKDLDGLILSDTLSPSSATQLRRYLQAWDVFMQDARARGMRPVFVYFPAYPQIYDVSTSLKIRDVLRDHSAKRQVPFLDLTPILRAQDDRILHLAPTDFHPNPEGNRVMGEALANFLAEVVLPLDRR